jgi:hypothetical protein
MARPALEAKWMNEALSEREIDFGVGGRFAGVTCCRGTWGLLGQGRAIMNAGERVPGCRSSVVEHPLGKGEVVSSILPGSTMISIMYGARQYIFEISVTT